MNELESSALERGARDSLTRFLLLYLAFVVYGSLVPLQFEARSMASAVASFGSIPFLNLGIGSRADWTANLLLFVPLAFFANSLFALNHRGLRRLLLSFVVVTAAVLLAVGIEFTQLFFPARTVSQNDILAESTGALVGVALSWVFHTRFMVWMGGFWLQQTTQDRASKLLQAYLLLLLIFNVLPLDLTLSPVELYRKWREGRVLLLPFMMYKEHFSTQIYEVATDYLIWVPVGSLWAMRSDTTAKSVLIRGMIAAGGIELAQLFVYSRYTDVTDVWLAGAGAATGWVLMRPFRQAMPSWFRSMRRHWLMWWAAWAIVTLAVFWFPFNVTWDHASIATATDALTRLPLTTYYFTSEYHAINEVLRKVGFFVPGGLLLGISARITRQGVYQATWIRLFPLVVVAFGLEAGQLLLPGKVADLTDALLECGGGALGFWVGQWLTAPGRAQSDTDLFKPLTRPNPPLPLFPPRQRIYRPSRPGFKVHLACVVVVAVVIGTLATVPGVPYNIGELVKEGPAGMLSAFGLSLAIYGLGNGAFLLLMERWRRALFAFPLWLLVHGFGVWVLLRLSVPLESLHDLVGSPVLGWPWEWELLGRYLALHVVVVTQILGAALCVRAMLNLATLPQFVYWTVGSAALAWPLHLVVVDWAATDNLTELLAGNGSFPASSAIAGGLFLMCFAASAMSASFHARQRKWILLGLALVGGAGATALFWLGSEHTIVKYGRVFSAFQFLLSSDRAHYLHGDALVLRYVLAFSLACGGLAALQWFSWRWICSDLSGAPHRRSLSLTRASPSKSASRGPGPRA